MGDKFQLWEKIIKEVRNLRFAGPFDAIPFDSFIQSPVGLVQKAGNQTRLIFHLSYKFKNGNESVNYYMPKHLCSVKYNDIEHAIKNCLALLQECE